MEHRDILWKLEMAHEILLMQLEYEDDDPNAVAKAVELIEDVLDTLDQRETKISTAEVYAVKVFE